VDDVSITAGTMRCTRPAPMDPDGELQSLIGTFAAERRRAIVFE
jgi:hypothetical protein